MSKHTPDLGHLHLRLTGLVWNKDGEQQANT